jgi:hypothetical protein
MTRTIRIASGGAWDADGLFHTCIGLLRQAVPSQFRPRRQPGADNVGQKAHFRKCHILTPKDCPHN